jgi:hypothetical protein
VTMVDSLHISAGGMFDICVHDISGLTLHACSGISLSFSVSVNNVRVY